MDVVRLLLARNEIQINQCIKATEEKDLTPLIIASYMGYCDIVLLLLQKKEIDTSLRFLEQTAMDWAQPEARCGVLEYLDGKISQEGRLKIVERLQTALRTPEVE